MPTRDELATPSTQLVADRDAYLGQGRHDVGRRIAEDQVELFAAGDAASSLQLEFEQHTSEFIALHDVGDSASLRLLASLAGSAGSRVQRLMIRRQGHGVALAVLQFVELPLSDGACVRVYSTDINTDGASRAALARVLLGWSRLGVLLVGELPPHAMAAALAPLQEAISRGPWPNRELLLIPLGASGTLAARGQPLAAGSPVSVHVAPRASKPHQVWGFVSGTWNRLGGQGGAVRALETDITRAMPRPLPRAEATMAPAPAARDFGAPRSQRTMPASGGTPWQAYVDRCMAVKGALTCCVFDMHSAQPLAARGGPPAADRLAQQGAALLAAAADSARALGLPAHQQDVVVGVVDHHLLVRPVPGHPGVALHLVLSASTGNPALAHLQLERIEPPA